MQAATVMLRSTGAPSSGSTSAAAAAFAATADCTSTAAVSGRPWVQGRGGAHSLSSCPCASRLPHRVCSGRRRSCQTRPPPTSPLCCTWAAPGTGSTKGHRPGTGEQS
eukprot:1320477-Rhodomonas_salina.2